MAKVGRALNEIVLNLLARGRLAHDELLGCEILPGELLLSCEEMGLRENGEDALAPQMEGVAAGPLARPGQERNVDPQLTNGCDMFLGISIDQFDADIGMVSIIGAQEFGQEARNE